MKKGKVEKMGRGVNVGKSEEKVGTVSLCPTYPRLPWVTDAIRHHAQAV